ISYWAAVNPWPARLVIILGHLLLGIFAIYLGNEFRELEIILPKTFLYITVIVFLVISFFYPSIKCAKFPQQKQVKYYLLKVCNGLVLACSFSAMIYIFNHVNFLPTRFATCATQPHKDSSVQKRISVSEILTSLQFREKSSLTKFEKRLPKKEFRKQLKIYSKAKLN